MLSESSFVIAMVAGLGAAMLARYLGLRIVVSRGYGMRKRRILVTISMFATLNTVMLLFLFGLHWWTLPILPPLLVICSLYWVAFFYMTDVIMSMLHLHPKRDTP